MKIDPIELLDEMELDSFIHLFRMSLVRAKAVTVPHLTNEENAKRIMYDQKLSEMRSEMYELLGMALFRNLIENGLDDPRKWGKDDT